MMHPQSLDLEAFACGDEIPSVADHLPECEACRAFVAGLRGLVARGPTASEAKAAVDRARRQAPAQRRLWWTVSSVVAPMAMAAAVLLMLRTPGDVKDRAGVSVNVPVAVDSSALNSSATRAPGVEEPETTFKGGPLVAVVRERGKGQARFSSSVRVQANDRLRIEVALDREQVILGAVLGDDGSYLELMAPAPRGAGTHFSERSARIDASPTHGTILIGSPAAVAKARQTQRFEGVTTLRVDSEGEP